MTNLSLRYWAAARAAAGCETETHPGSTVGEALDAAAAAHPELGRVLAVSSLLVDGHRVGRETTSEQVRGLVQDPSAATVEVLPPFAGG